MTCVALVLVTGCGGSEASGDEASKPAAREKPAAPTRFDASEIANYLHLKNDTYTAPNGQQCDVAVVLTSADEVEMYADAGDAVAMNPSGTAGVKVVDPESATCLRLLTTALMDFPTS